MPLFTRSRRKSESKRRRGFGLSTARFGGFSSPYPNPRYQSSQHVVNQSPARQAPPPPSFQRQWSAPAPQQQIAPHPYPYLSSYASSPYLPSPCAPPRLPVTQAHEQQNRWNSCQNLPDTVAKPYQMVSATVNRTTEYLNRGAALCDQVASKFNDVINLMDEETFAGNEQDLHLTYHPYLGAAQATSPPRPQVWPQPVSRGRPNRALAPVGHDAAVKSDDRLVKQNALTTANVFEKATMYANSRLPAELPPFTVYVSTWPLICLAARYSLNTYCKPSGAEKDAYVDADWRIGTKAMVIKSVPIDDMNAVVFAIRGTQNFLDWAVNLNTATVSPEHFLDDPGNLCHAGFLDVARKMIKPVAARLRQLLEENPNRSACSLVITGHSAGGAVASLLFCHMLSVTMKSELNVLTRRFKRLHCVTFGAPPVSLLPLSKPAGQERKLWKHLFVSFINEGDPVTRADKAYVRSLLELYAGPPPKRIHYPRPGLNGAWPLTSKPVLPAGWWNSAARKKFGLRNRHNAKSAAAAAAAEDRPDSDTVWRVPPATLSNAGRLVVLRVPHQGRHDDVRAFVTDDQLLRRAVFGDPMMHQMKLYHRRIEALAKKAATGRQ